MWSETLLNPEPVSIAVVVKAETGRRRYILARAEFGRERWREVLEPLSLTMRPIYHGSRVIVRVRHWDLRKALHTIQQSGAAPERVAGTMRSLRRWLRGKGDPMPPRRRRRKVR